jgi:hypothetical protein
MGGGQKLLARAPLPLLFSVFFFEGNLPLLFKGPRTFLFFAPGHSFGRSRGPGSIGCETKIGKRNKLCNKLVPIKSKDLTVHSIPSTN